MTFVIEYRVEGQNHTILKQGSMRVKNAQSKSEALIKLNEKLKQVENCVEVFLLKCEEEYQNQSGDQTLDYLKSIFRM